MDFEDLMREKFPREFAMYKAIERTLRPEERGFDKFHRQLGLCPAGYGLRRKRDGKRAPFRLSNYEYVDREAPRRVDTALVQAERGQMQTARLEDFIPAPAPAAPPKPTWHLVPDGADLLIVESETVPPDSVGSYVSEELAKWSRSEMIPEKKRVF